MEMHRWYFKQSMSQNNINLQPFGRVVAFPSFIVSAECVKRQLFLSELCWKLVLLPPSGQKINQCCFNFYFISISRSGWPFCEGVLSKEQFTDSIYESTGSSNNINEASVCFFTSKYFPRKRTCSLRVFASWVRFLERIYIKVRVDFYLQQLIRPKGHDMFGSVMSSQWNPRLTTFIPITWVSPR